MNTFSFAIAFVAAFAFATANPCGSAPAMYSLRESEPTAKVSSGQPIIHGHGSGLGLGSGSLGSSWGLGGSSILGGNGLNLDGLGSTGLAGSLASLGGITTEAIGGSCPTPAPVVSVAASPLPNNIRGETVIHQPKPIIIRRPATHVTITHPPIVVRPAAVAFHKPPARIYRPVIVKPLPPSVQIEPIFKKIMAPPQRKLIVSQPQCHDALY